MNAIKDFELTCNIINIKIHSDEPDKQSLYIDTITKVLNLKEFSVSIGNKNRLQLLKLDKFSLTSSSLNNELINLEHDEYVGYLGEFVKFKVEDINDKYYDTSKKEVKSADPNSVVKPNAHEIPFYFVPSIHRLFLPVNSKISPQKVVSFFKEAFLQLFESDSFFNIDIIKSQEEVNRIFKFQKLESIELNISYTNDDLGDDEKEFMDELIKEANATNYQTKLKAEKDQSLNLKSKIVKGGTELSKENGTVIARGINDLGVKETINTKNKYEELFFSIKKGEIPILSIIKDSIIKWRARKN